MNAQSSGRSLTEGAIGRTLVLFSLPILAGNVLQSLNGSVNAVWVGRYLGEAALTATSNANLILFFLLSLVFGIGMAASILVGQAIGANDVALARRVVGSSATFFVGVAAACAIGGWLATPWMLAHLSMPPDALPLAADYLRVIFLALPFMFGFTYVMMVLRGAGDARTPFVFLVLSVVLDIALNPLFIFGLAGLPAMGIAGSATATLVANAVSLAAMVAYLYWKRHFLRLARGDLRHLVPDPAIFRSLVAKGLPMGLQMIVMSLAMIVMIAFVNRYGSHTVAAYGAASQLWTYIQMPGFAIGAAVSTMAAQNVGAGRWDRVERIAHVGVGVIVALTGALVLVIYAFNRGALGLFLPDDSNALAQAQHINAIVVWSFVFFGVALVFSAVVRSTGAVIPPLVNLVVALWLVRIPFAWLMTDAWQADALWWSFPLGSFVAALLAAAYYRWGRWRNARMIAPAAR